MAFDEILNDYIRTKAGEVIITDRRGLILYRNHAEAFDDRQWEIWSQLNIEAYGITQEEDWEISDASTGNYFNVHSVPVVYEGEEVLLHHLFNNSDYAALLREVSGYLKDWRELSSFQTAILEKLSGNYESCLPIIIRFFKIKTAVLYIGRGNLAEEYILDKEDKEIRVGRKKRFGLFDVAEGDHKKLAGVDDREFICFINGKAISGTEYALYLCDEDLDDDRSYKIHYNVIKLFIENALLREQIIYESEHDQLTGLYNKGKYMSMMESFFPKCEKIAIYNMDVNYLKRTNDTLGHEAGDALIVKAAKSLKTVESDKVYGFRMGGDEFMMIAWDLEESEAEAIKKEWEINLNTINRTSDDTECVIACGLAYGSGDFDLKALLKTADELMYENKVAIKISRGEDPNSRL